MGGPGSGRWYRSSGRGTCESQHRLDVRWLARRGFLQPGAYGPVSWTRGGEPSGDIRVFGQAGGVELRYRVRVGGGDWEPVQQPVGLSWTPCTFGGRRPWFLCPQCRRRTAILYAAGRLFLCRGCSGLAYQSQHEGPAGRAMLRMQRTREQLGEHDTKPKGMHWRTYERLLDRLEVAEGCWAEGTLAMLRRTTARLEARRAAR